MVTGQHASQTNRAFQAGQLEKGGCLVGRNIAGMAGWRLAAPVTAGGPAVACLAVRQGRGSQPLGG